MPKEDPCVNRAQLLKAIKKYPEIWDSNNKLHMCRSVTAPMWNEIAEQFGGHVPTVKLQSIWSQMKYHYHNLVHRQILHKEHFTTKWEHFEPMSFMYAITVAKIVGIPANGSNTIVDSNLPSSPPLPQTHGRGRPSGSFAWVPSVVSQSDINVETTPFTAFAGVASPAPITITVETVTTPLRKPGRPGSLNNNMRGRIIDAIKSRPILWSRRQKEQKERKNRTSIVWREVAVELSLTPSLVQTRWSIIKQRYVDELQKERHARFAHESFHSNWEHFERMSFMREILAKKVDEREITREHIQEIVNEKQQTQQQNRQQEQQQQQQQHFSQHHFHRDGDQQLRYIRNDMSNNTAGSHILQLPHSHSHSHSIHTHPLHHELSMCNEKVGPNQFTAYNPTSVSNSNGNGSSTSSLGLIPTTNMRGRRIKNETDLEWDPFEMILHVQSAPNAENN